MLCKAGGYEYEEKWDAEKRRFLRDVGDRQFIVVKGSFHVEREGNWGSHIDEVTVYACPKCGPLKLNEKAY